jgi:hypothetical protein
MKLGTRLETRPRYTPTTCFETFPFPDATAEQQAAIAAAAKEINELRECWLNPPEWTREEVWSSPPAPPGRGRGTFATTLRGIHAAWRRMPAPRSNWPNAR